MILLNTDALNDIDPDVIMIDAATLARIVSLSKEWVIKNRARIYGAQKVGGRWRFNLAIIRDRLARRLDIVPATPPRPRTPYKPRTKKV